ncbi:MAG: GTP-binding protein [Promethearchaeota archaeon]
MIIDSLEKLIQIKIVYFGPALSGKTTSLKALFKHFGKEEQVKSIESTIKRTLFFDYGTISFQNKRWLLKIHIYSTTGQDFYVVTRPVTLRAIDGIIFVIDSQKAAWKRNLISWKELESYFSEEFIDIPKVLAFNKQDLPDKFNPNDFLREIDFKRYNNMEIRYTIAISGEEILASFEDVLKLIFKELYQSKLVTTPSL